MATRDHVIFWINGQRREVRGDDCFLTLAEYLRTRLGLVGTKIVCSEGDCGSCTVLVGNVPIDSCIRFVFQLDGADIVTIEGLSAGGELMPIQQAMIDCHGSQCGFCTPGFVMAMTGLCGQANDDDAWRHGLTGNLCRCTGYSPILAAACQAGTQPRQPTARSTPRDILDLCGQRRAYCPTALDDALAFRAAHPEAKVIAGATDLGVHWNKRSIDPALLLDLNRVTELEGVTLSDGRLVAGARATWTDLLAVCETTVPEFAQILSIFGSPQIRHVGTIGGNLINASPIADSLPFLYVMGAELELANSQGTRCVNVNGFYRGYKQFDLRPDELLTAVQIPLPADDELLRLYKVSRRRDLDIATFTAAIRMRLDGDRIAEASLAYGAVAPTIVRLRETEEFLHGRPFNEETLHAAGDIAVGEISPISDVRGSAEYRRQLARNVLLKFYYEHAHDRTACTA